jgi:hypothetical protein
MAIRKEFTRRLSVIFYLSLSFIISVGMIIIGIYSLNDYCNSIWKNKTLFNFDSIFAIEWISLIPIIGFILNPIVIIAAIKTNKTIIGFHVIRYFAILIGSLYGILFPILFLFVKWPSLPLASGKELIGTTQYYTIWRVGPGVLFKQLTLGIGIFLLPSVAGLFLMYWAIRSCFIKKKIYL